MEFIETKNQSNIVSPRVKKAMGSFITWALLAQSYLGYGAIRPNHTEKVIEIKNYGNDLNPIKKEISFVNSEEDKKENKDEKATKSETVDKIVKKSNRTLKAVKTVVAYKATLKEGTIGAFAGRKLDNPADNIFHIKINQQPTISDKVWLEYELNGLANAQSVSKSINDRLATGGYLIKTKIGWSKQREPLNPVWLKKGDNSIQFSLPENTKYGYQIKNIRLVIEKNNNDEALIVEKNHTLYNNKGYVKGFIQGMDPEAQILVDGKAVIYKNGVFETIVSMETPQPVKIEAILSNGKKEEKTLNFTQNHKADYTYAINNTHQTVSKYFEKGISNQLKIKGAELEVNEKALKGTEKISITTLRHIDLPALDMGMTNTTKDFKGYRFLPHGEHFKEGAIVKLAYDRTKIPNGYTENDIKTYYFDTKTHHWVALERDSIDKKNQIIISKTTHFTDMINGVIQTPESPESQGFAPTSMSDIKAADPTAKIQVMAAPSANQRGSATTSYSFEMPPARNGMAPSLGIQYNSDGGSGWLGEGWDLNIPSITVDTRWGVPRYNGDLETETYSFNGSMLAMLDDEGNPAVAHRGDQIKRENERRFYPRKEGSFSKIVRKGDGFGNTIWEVTDKKGTVYTYGDKNGVDDDGAVLKGTALDVASGKLKDDVIVEWRLSKIEELHGDYIEYYYDQVEEEVKGDLKSRALYLKKVVAGQDGSGDITEIVFTQKSEEKIRKTNNARYGFLTSNHQLLDRVDVKFEGKTLRSYGFTYDTGAFSKKRLKTITQYNSEGKEFNHHDLDYYNDVAYEKDKETYKPFKTELENLNAHDDGVKGEGVIGALGKASSLSGTQSKGNSFGLGLSVDFPSDKKFTCKGPLSVGGSFSYASSKGEGKLVLVDINGDGLADKVYKSGSSLFYRPNLTSNADENGYNSLSDETDINIEYGDPVAIQGTSNFLKTKGKTTAGGFNIGYTSCSNFGVDAGVNIANSESETQVYFQDVNGDGLIDIVSKGAVLFNATDKDTGIVRFNQNSSLTPSPIAAGGTISSDVVKENVEEVWNQNVLEYPLHDVVRVWEAPFDGTVKIEGTVTVLAPQGTEDIDYDGDEYDQADGVQVSIDLGNQSNEGKASNLWKKKLNKPENKATTVSETHMLTGKLVKKGQRIYFRVQSGNIERANGAFDDVDWNPIITFTDSKHHTGNNPDTQKAYSYKASEGFVVENDEPFTVFPKEDGHRTAVKIEGQFTKPVTSDAISVQVYKIDRIKENEEERVEKTLKWCKTFTSEEAFDDLLTASFELASLEEGEDGHNLKIEFNSDTNIEWNKIQWDARMTQYDEGNYTKKNPRIGGKLIPSTTQEYLSSYIDVKENSLEEKVDYGNNVWWSSLFLDHKPFKEGKIEVTIDSSVNGQQYFMIGLSPETDKEKSYSYEGVDYALYNRNFSGQIYEKGNYINGVSFAVSSGDILSVELKDNKVNYFVNNQIVYTSHASSLDEKYVGHLVFYNPRNAKQNYGIGAKDIKITDYTTNSTISLKSNESQPYHANYIKVENHIIKPLRQSSGKRIARLEYKEGFKEGRVDFDVSTGANLRHIVGLSDGEITTGYVNYAIKNTKYAIYLDNRNAQGNYFTLYENGIAISNNSGNTYNQYYEDGETFSIEVVNGKVYYYKSSQEEPIYISQNVPTANEYNLIISGTNEFSPTAYISNVKIADYANDNHNVSCDGSSNIESFGTLDGEETYPYVDYGVKAEHAIEGAWYMVQDIETDKLKVTPALTFTDTTKANGSVVLSVKSADQVQLLGKQTLTYVNGIVTPSVIPLEVEAEKGDQLWIEYTTEDVTFVGNINQGTTVKKNVNITELDTPLCITTPELNLSGQHTATQNYEAVTINSTATMSTAVEVEYKGGEVVHLKPSFHADSSNSGQFHAFIDDSNCGPDQVLLNDDVLGNVFTNIVNDKFGPMYRHWGQFVYNGNPDRLASPIDESLLVGSDDQYQTEDDIPELPTGVSETGKEYTTDELDTLSANNEYKPEDEIFVEMIPKLVVERNEDQSYQDIKPLWQGQDPESYIVKEEMSSTRLGEDDIRPFSVQLEEMLANVSTEGEGEGTICTLEGGMAYGVPKKTKTKSTSYALGGSTPIGGGSYSESNGSTEQLLDFMDINGDRYPDVVGKSTIQYTETTGKLGSLSKAYEGGINESNNKSKGITAGGSYSHSGPVASGQVTKTRTVIVMNDSGKMESKTETYVEKYTSARASASFGLSGQVSENEDDAEHTFLDLNGDGLPDKLYKGGMVAINYGYHFGEKTEWGFNTIREGKSINVGGGINFGGSVTALTSNSREKGSGSIQIGTGMSWSKTTVNYSITDVNSDGLPDLVRKVTIGVDDKGMDTEAKLMVSLNLGDRFASEIEWNGASQINQSRSFGMSGNLAFTVCIPILPPPLDAVKICVNPSGGLNTGFSRDEYQLTDIDADGFIDVVESNEEGELKTYRSTIARTNKLKSVTNPLGGRYTVDYAKSAATYDHPNGKWVMSSVEVDDGIHDDGANMKTAFRYGKGKYDRHEREFLGFGKVMAESLDQNDVVYRTATQEFDVSDYYKAGNLTASYLEDKDGKKYTKSTNEYYVYSVTDSTDDNYQFSVPTTVNEETNKPRICSDRGIGFTPMKYAESKAYEGQETAATLTQSFYEYYLNGHFGDLKSYKYTDKGTLSNTGSGSYNYMTSIEYKTYDKTNRIYGLPTRVKVQDQSGNLYRQTEATYQDGFANHITQVRQQLNDTDWAETDIEYDRYGNITKKTLPANKNNERMWYKYRYDRDYDMYVERIDDAFEYRTEFEEFDYRYGIPLVTRDYNDYEIHKTIDEYGRLETVTGPNELANGVDYTIAFEYHPIAEVTADSSQPRAIKQPAYAITKHYDEEHPGDDLETITFVDGTGRAIQVKKDGKIIDKDNPTYSEHGLIVSGRAFFDDYGRVQKAYYPSWEHGFDNKTTFNTTFDAVTPTQTTYDVLDRAVVTKLPDGSETKMTYSTDNSTLLKTMVEDAEGGKKGSFTNGSGLTMKVEEKGSSDDPYNIVTTYEYNPINELLKVIDTKGNEIVSTYDLAGRRTSVTHPDAGTSTFKYDTSSNLVEKQTANLATQGGTSITYDYDYTRLVGVNYPEHPENNVKYYYGNKHANHNRIGRLVLQEDATGAQEFYYGRLGELTEVRRTLIVPNNAIATYVTKWRYDSWNRLQEMIYPDEEKITYDYNSGGLLESVKGEKTFTYNYVNQLGYDKFEQRTYLKYCNGAETKYTYENDRRRLSNLSVWDGAGKDGNGAHNQIINNAYTYDKVSNVLGVTNSASSYESSVISGVTSSAAGVSRSVGGSMSHEYTYDGLYRLKIGTGTFTGGNGKTASYELTMGYDNLHNITSKKQEVEQSGIMFDGALKSGYDLSYTYNEERPHQMAMVADDNYRTEGTATQNPKHETHNYQYDANGNLIYVNTARVKADEHTEDKVHERKLLWDEENRLEAISDNGYVSNYWYDAAGERTVKTSGDGEGVYVQSVFAGGRTQTTDFILYVNPYLVVRNGGAYTKHIYMGGQRIVSKLGDMDSFGEDPRRIEYAGSEAEEQNGESIMPDYEAKYKLSYEVMKARYDSLQVPYHGTDNDDYQGGTGFCCDPVTSSTEGVSRSSRVAQNENPELYQYYYHADHLGSSSYITDLNGEVAQHIEYVPFGEVFIEERNNTWNTPYLFNGKELDEETGLYYYGARYYNPRVSQWLSVDPIALYDPINEVEHYLDGQHNGGYFNPRNTSVYGYTYQNPIVYVDPNGKQNVIGGIGINNRMTGEVMHKTISGESLEQHEQVVANVIDIVLPIEDTRRAIHGTNIAGEEDPITEGEIGVVIVSAVAKPLKLLQKVKKFGGKAWKWVKGLFKKSKKTPTPKPGTRYEPKDLQEQLTLEEAKGGAGKPIMKGKLKDKKYDPEKGTHDKYGHNHDHGDGTSTEIHYDVDRKTGKGSGYKIKDDTNAKSRGNN